MSPVPVGKKALKKMRVHLLVETPGGPVVSRPADGTIPVGGKDGGPNHFAVLCDPSIVMDGKLERGTGEPWGVRCDACRAKMKELGLERDKPGLRPAPEQEEADGKADCGCGG